MTDGLRLALEKITFFPAPGALPVQVSADVRTAEDRYPPRVDLLFGVPIAAMQQEIEAAAQAICAANGAAGARITVRQRIDAHAPQG